MKMKPFKREVLKRHIGVHKKELFIFIFEGKGKVLRGIKFWGRLWRWNRAPSLSPSSLAVLSQPLTHSTLSN